MTDTIQLAAEARARAGKGTARATRRGGRIPAVIYGAKQPPVMISVEERELTRLLHRPGFFTHMYDISVDGQTHKALARDVQMDPVKDRPIHVDFLRVSEGTTISVEVPVVFVNQEKSPGLKMGGTLNVVRHAIEVSCRADTIPEQIAVDLAGAEMNASIHISAVTLPAGVTPTITDRDFTIATIVAPSGLKSEAADEAAAAGAAQG